MGLLSEEERTSTLLSLIKTRFDMRSRFSGADLVLYTRV